MKDPLLERDICKIIKQYLIRDAFFDITANVPILVYTIIYGMPRTNEEIEEADSSTLFRVLMFLKILRLFHVYEVIQTLDRLMTKLAEIFYVNRHIFMNILSWVIAIIKFLLCMHYYACVWLWL